MDARTLYWKPALLATTMRPALSASRCFHASSPVLRSGAEGADKRAATFASGYAILHAPRRVQPPASCDQVFASSLSHARMESFATPHVKKNVRLFMHCLIRLVDGVHGRIDRDADLSFEPWRRGGFGHAAVLIRLRPIVLYNICDFGTRSPRELYIAYALPNVISRPGEFTPPWREAALAGKAPPSPRAGKARPGRSRPGLDPERRFAASRREPRWTP